MDSFFIASVLAIFIALLAWGDAMRKPQEFLAVLEKEFIQNLKIKKSKILPILDDESEFTFLEQMTSLIDLWETDFGKIELQLRNNIITLRSKKQSIEKYYTFRYYFVITMLFISIIFSGISLSIGNEKLTFLKIKYFPSQSVDELLMMIYFICIILVVFNLIRTNQKEKSFLDILNKSNDLLLG